MLINKVLDDCGIRTVYEKNDLGVAVSLFDKITKTRILVSYGDNEEDVLSQAAYHMIMRYKVGRVNEEFFSKKYIDKTSK